MELPRTIQKESCRVIVVANEKGGSGKSTVAIHLAVALMKAGVRVATIDLDARQKSLSRYIENRRAWAAQIGRELETPDHYSLDDLGDHPTAEEDSRRADALFDVIDVFAADHGVIIIDTPGHKSYVTMLVHALADTLITPLNDSFVDFDVLGTVDPASFQVTGTSHYAAMVAEARRKRSAMTAEPTDWIVLRNRVSTLSSRNKRLIGEGLQELGARLDFRSVGGLSERVIFREFYPRGLTALDDVNEATLGTRPTLSHAAARQEVATLIDAIGLEALGAADQNLDAA